MRRVCKTAAALSLIFAASAGWASTSRLPEYVPYCGGPQVTAPMQAVGGAEIYSRTDAVWNGRDYAVVWVDESDFHLHFRRFFADGTPVGPTVVPLPMQSYGDCPPSLVWNGYEYGVAWMGIVGGTLQVYFARLDTNGVLVGSSVKASFVGLPETTAAVAPSLAWSGSGYAVAWGDDRNGTYDIFATLLNADGTVSNSGASHDLVICSAINQQFGPCVAWSQGGGRYRIVWQDYRSGSHFEIWGASLLPSGVINADTAALVTSTASSQYPSLRDSGNGLGLVWSDDRDGNDEIYFALLNDPGYRLGPDVRLTDDPAISNSPCIVWTGAEYGVFWADLRSGTPNLWFQRVSSAGTPQGTNIAVTATSDLEYPGAGFGRYGFLVTGTAFGYANFVQPWGCASDTTPPTCPGNLLAYNVTGTSATIAWLPSTEDVTDIAYYQIYRDNTPLARTSGTYYTDGGLGLSSTYNFAVQPVNAAQLINGGCVTSIYVKTNATLILKLDKMAPDAHLTWTNAFLNSYNVFRGTSPQVMSKIGSTAGMSFDDPNVLSDGVLYFYTVDEPGL